MTPPKNWFKQIQLYHQALTHRSFVNEHPGVQSNERLEFLGDSILSFLISVRLFDMFPQATEGELTNRRSQIVQTSTLANKAILLGLDSELRLSRGEQNLGGRQNPGLLADTFEAVFGALYLDGGIEACKIRLEEIFPDDDIKSQKDLKDPKSLLQELSQGRNLGTPSYTLLEATGPDHAKTFEVSVSVNGKIVATGTGSSKQKAEIEAAQTAISKLFPEFPDSAVVK